MITVSLQEKNGIYHAVINYRNNNNNRKQKWVSTHLKTRGNKKQALLKAEKIRRNFEIEHKFQLTNTIINEKSKDILFIDYMKNWLKIIKPTIEPNTYGSYE